MSNDCPRESNIHFIVPGLPYFDEFGCKASQSLATYVYLLVETVVSIGTRLNYPRSKW